MFTQSVCYTPPGKILYPTYESYYEMINALLKSLGNKTNFKNNQLTESTFCDVDEDDVKNLLNNKIAEVISNDGRFQNNGSFQLENMSVIDLSITFYEDADNKIYIKARFNLSDLSRNASNEAYALIAVTDPELKIESAGLVYSNVGEDTSSIIPVNSVVSASSWDQVNQLQFKGGISTVMNAYLDSL